VSGAWIVTVGAARLGATDDPAGMMVARALLAEGVPVTSRQVVDEDETAVEEALRGAVEAAALVVVLAITAGVEFAFVAIPSQTALQEDLPHDVRGRIFGILNTLLSVASFFPVIAAPIIADLVDIVLPGLGIPIVLLALSAFMAWVAFISWRQNAAQGLHKRTTGDAPAP